MRWDARADHNQKEIITALRAVGASVIVLHRVGQGCPDLACGFRGQNHFLEVKASGGRLTPAEKEFFETWRGQASIVHNQDEALEAIGAVA